jgi:hypothetical protein
MLKLAHSRYGFLVHPLPFWNSYADCSGAFFRSALKVLLEIILNHKPIRFPAPGVEQDQNDWHVVEHPEVVISDVQVEDIHRVGGTQRFCSLDLKEHQTRFKVTIFIVAEQDQVLAIIAVHALDRMAGVDDEPFDMVNALVRDYVLPGPLFARSEHWFGHGSGAA